VVVYYRDSGERGFGAEVTESDHLAIYGYAKIKVSCIECSAQMEKQTSFQVCKASAEVHEGKGKRTPSLTRSSSNTRKPSAGAR